MTPFEVTVDDGCRLAGDVCGPADGPGLVLLHALGLDRTVWDDVTPALAASCRVVRLDLRGHGASESPAAPWTIERLGRDVVAAMDALGLARAHVAGVSLGGLVTLWLGIHAPGRVQALVPANTAARIGTPDSWRDRIDTVTAHGLEPIARAAAPRWFTASFIADAPARVDACLARLRTTSVEGYLHTCALLRDTDLRPEIGAIRAVTAVVGGTADVATPPADAAWLAATIPGAALHLLPAGHLSSVERPADFVAAMRTVLTVEAP